MSSRGIHRLAETVAIPLMIYIRHIRYLLIILLYLLSLSSAFAVIVTINNYPQTISTEAFNVDVTINGAKPGTNYLRIDLYKEGTTHYFGETFNGASWFGGSDGKQYSAININENEIASASVKARVGDPTNTEYSGPGKYKMKIRRYTVSGNSAEVDLNPVDVQINIVLPSFTPIPQATPKSTATPKPNPSPTVTPSSNSVVPSPTTTVKLTKATPSSISTSEHPLNPDILEGISTNTAGTEEATVAGISNEKPQFPVGILFIGAGILFSAAAGATYYQIAKNK